MRNKIKVQNLLICLFAKKSVRAFLRYWNFMKGVKETVLRMKNNGGCYGRVEIAPDRS